jgi:hypothetical protein
MTTLALTLLAAALMSKWPSVRRQEAAVVAGEDTSTTADPVTIIETTIAARRILRERLTREQADQQRALAQIEDDERKVVLDAYQGSAHAQARQQVLVAARRDSEDRQRSLALGIEEVSSELTMLDQQLTVAVHLRDEQALREAAEAVRVAGADVDQAFAHATEKLKRFIELDVAATGFAHRLRQPEGRFLGDRITSALAHHLVPVLQSLVGTSVILSVGDARRHLDFRAASTRPFSPREDAPESVVEETSERVANA